jgi:hypothetical protein
MRGSSWGAQWTHVLNNYYNLNTCLIHVNIHEHMWMGHECTKTVGGARHRLDFTTASGTKKNPIVKSLWNKFWTYKTTVKILYSGDIHVFFKRASCGFVCLTDLAFKQTHTHTSFDRNHTTDFILHSYSMIAIFFIISFHYITYVMNNANNILITDQIPRVILASLFLGQNILFSPLFSNTSLPILLFPQDKRARFTPIIQRTKYSY